MSDRSTNSILRSALAATTIASALGCGYSPITSARIEGSIGQTFANLVQVQVSSLGLPAMGASDFGVKASCRKLLPGNSAGAGEWVCALLWQGPDRRILRDTYELFVTTDGCYTASVASESLGGPILRAENGSEVRNLLYTFEGCFETT